MNREYYGKLILNIHAKEDAGINFPNMSAEISTPEFPHIFYVRIFRNCPKPMN